MEKFSAYRDPGTGIQPFLTPVPPVGSNLLANVTLPLRCILGFVRTVLVFVLLLTYVTLVEGLCLIFTPVPPLRRTISSLLTSALARAVLLVLGFFWIPVEQVTRKKGKAQKQNKPWNPQGGDVVVSNWVSWVELLWLAFRFNPIFVLPVPETLSPTFNPPSLLTSTTHTPGRRTGTGSANIQSPNKTTTARVPIIGYRQVSLLSIIRLTGQVPPFRAIHGSPRSLENIRKSADRPVVVFPECTTSNGRGLLRFSEVFLRGVPVKDYQVFVMCVRCDPPTNLAPTLTLSIPSNSFNPLLHLFALTASAALPAISIRLLAPSDSPSSQLFIASEVITDFTGKDQLAETCAALVAQIGKMKRTGMGWEDKANFLEFYRGKRK